MKDKNKIENWYKSVVENNSEYPPNDVWEGIQDDLDVDQVWTNLDSTLKSEKKKKLLGAMAIAASFLIIITITGYLFYSSDIITIQQPEITEQPDNYIDQQLLPSEAIKEVDSQKISDFTDNSFESRNETVLVAERVIPPAEKYEDIERSITYDNLELFFLPNRISNDFVYYLQEKEIENLAVNVDVDENSFKNLLDKDIADNSKMLSSLYVGFNGQISNTWLLNNKTYQGIKRDEFTKTNLSFGKNIGLLLGTNISEHTTVEAEFYFVSETNQKYNEYLNGKYINNAIKLEYYTASLKFNYNIKSLNKPHTLIFGSYVGFLQNATQNLNDDIKKVTNYYSSWDWGIIVGYQYPFAVSEKLSVSIGPVVKYGFNNVFSGDNEIPDFLNKTHNASVNLSVGIKYSIK